MKFKKLIFTILFCFTIGLTLTACKGNTEVPSKEYDVIFDTDGGSTIENQVIAEGNAVLKPEDPTRAGYIFEGWYQDSAKKKPWNFSTSVITEETTIYAKWAKILSCLEASKLCEPENFKSTERCYIQGIVDTVSNPTYGEMTISDETGSLYVYGTYSSDGTKRYSELDNKPFAGDEVLLYGLLQNFKGRAELTSAWIISFTPQKDEFDESNYTKMSIAESREAEKNDKILVEGVVSKITYANGMIPSGFYLVDSTSSIYVYDSQIAPRVSVGNKVKLAGVKDLWILETEAGNAEKFGYKGCCQLTNAHLISSDNGNNRFDKNWIEQTTIKDIMETPVSKNITTLIYKVNALVHKSVGTGFINYYFYDIDGKTGSYAYTQCNGSDYEWLDEFDGKICTVYLSAINAKASASGCVWRFLPIEVIDEGYSFDQANAPKFAVDYYGVGQFLPIYTSDPKLELITEVSQELLGIKNITLEYSSNDTDIVSFDVENDKLIMHTKNAGTATITIKASYLDYEYSTTLQIKLESIDIPDTITIKEAIDSPATEGGTEVIVRGIVGPSLVNRSGFYLIDETGVIAITTDSETLSGLALGNEVILKGTRTLFGNEEGYYGQSVILDCELIINLYGEQDYSTATFDSSKTLDDLLAFNVSEDHTTQVYVVEVEIKVVEATYYSNIYLVSPQTNQQMILYCSGANQYSWLKKYAGQTITVELALCNWNKKKQFPGCVLSATGEDGTKEVNVLNFNK
ncbi:MAG: InlB B-repeat-containing protein [Anaeroplasmataceae bacterium]|nr:InlB B-repeat-containing protein [Anaeroplasmataceae bacterium]